MVLATAGYDHTVRFWEATSGICYRTLQYADSVRPSLHPTYTFTAAPDPFTLSAFPLQSHSPVPRSTVVRGVGYHRGWTAAGKAGGEAGHLCGSSVQADDACGLCTGPAASLSAAPRHRRLGGRPVTRY